MGHTCDGRYMTVIFIYKASGRAMPGHNDHRA
jgi:hypothetical protein